MNKQEILDMISNLANKKTCYEKGGEDGGYCGINDFAGGNIDDAYNLGIEDGEIMLARTILKLFNKS